MAEDMAQVLSFNESASVPYGSFDHLLVTRDVDHRLEDADGEPPLRLLVDGLPRREIVRQHAP